MEEPAQTLQAITQWDQGGERTWSVYPLLTHHALRLLTSRFVFLIVWLQLWPISQAILKLLHWTL